jgi:hypothetical protein
MEDQPMPPPPEAILSSSLVDQSGQPLNKKYVQLGTPSYVLAYLSVISIVVVLIMTASMILTDFSTQAIISGVVMLFLLYLNYNVVAHSINCDRQMYGKDPEFPTPYII